jgi:hypothetical protein
VIQQKLCPEEHANHIQLDGCLNYISLTNIILFKSSPLTYTKIKNSWWFFI